MQQISNDFHMMPARERRNHAQDVALRLKASAYRQLIERGEKHSAEATALRMFVVSQKHWLRANQRLSSRAVAEDRARRKKGARKL